MNLDLMTMYSRYNLPADAIIPPASSDDGTDEDEVYTPQEVEEPEEEPTQAPVEATAEDQTTLQQQALADHTTAPETNAATVAPASTPAGSRYDFSSPLIQTLLIVLAVMLVALFTVIIMIITKKSKQKKAANAGQPYQNPSGNGSDNRPRNG